MVEKWLGFVRIPPNLAGSVYLSVSSPFDFHHKIITVVTSRYVLIKVWLTSNSILFWYVVSRR